MVKHEDMRYERPPQGVAVEDPAYKTCITRITENYHNSPQIHARRQSFNKDSSYFLAYYESGQEWAAYDAKTGKMVRRLVGTIKESDPQWHVDDPNNIYYLYSRGRSSNMVISRYDLRNNAIVPVADLTTPLQAIWPTTFSMSTLGASSISSNGGTWCLLAERMENGVRKYGVFTWNFYSHNIEGSMNLETNAPSSIATSAGGKYCVISWNNEMGTRAYHSDFRTTPFNNGVSTNYLQLNARAEPFDMGTTKVGYDAYISVDNSATGGGQLFFTNLDTGKRLNLFRINNASGASPSLHISARNSEKPGWALVSTSSSFGSAVPWAYRKIFAVSLEEQPKIKNIAFNHSLVRSGNLEDETQVTSNREFTRLLFNSTWNRTDNRSSELYMAALPDNVIPDIARKIGDPTPVDPNDRLDPIAGNGTVPQSGNSFVNRAQNAANQLQQAQQNQNNLLAQINGISVKAMKNADGSLTVAKEAAKPVIIDGASQFKTPKELQRLIDEAAAKGTSAVLLKISGPDNYVLESELLGQTLATAQRDRDGIYTGAAGNNFYSRAQIGELENYARRQGIELIPEVNLPGQADFISKLLKRKDSDRAEQVFNGQTGEVAARFAQDLYGEVANAFGQSKHFHMGGSAFDGIVADNANYINFVNGNGKFLANRGLTPQLWNDGLLPVSLNKLDKAIEVGYRLEDGQRASKEALEAAGFKVIDQREEQAPQ